MEDVMSNTKKIVLAIAAVVIIALLVVAGITGGAGSTVKCPEENCYDGHVVCSDCANDDGIPELFIECPECEGKGECTWCNSTGEIDCPTCDANGMAKCETCGGEADVTGSIWAFLPPIIAIGLALITKEVFSSLFVGIVAGGILASSYSFTGTVDIVVSDGIISAVADTAGIFAFLVLLGVVVALINKAGGSAAFGRWAQTHIKTRAGAMFATFVLGILIFIDDYFNCLTVGSVMRPVTDSKKISRAKLSYLIDATAAPISSWAAAVSSYAEEGQSGLSLFIEAIPYNFYSLLTLVFVLGLIFINVDFGPMKLHEFNAVNNDDLYTAGEKAEVADVEPCAKGRIVDLILPIAVLIVSCISALVYNGYMCILDDGGFTETTVFGKLGEIFGNTDATVGLPWGGLIALVVIVGYLILRRLVSFKESMECLPKGFIAMVPAILILTLATALKNITSILGAKYFIADAMANYSLWVELLPAIIFLIACVLSFATGTSWGTFGILIPIVLALDLGGALPTIAMSACLAGAVCGDHCSPISDTTIMSSAGGQCNHLNHVSTQLPYAITVAAISFIMFVVAGFVQNALICLGLGVVLTLGILFIIKSISKDKKKA